MANTVPMRITTHDSEHPEWYPQSNPAETTFAMLLLDWVNMFPGEKASPQLDPDESTCISCGSKHCWVGVDPSELRFPSTPAWCDDCMATEISCQQIAHEVAPKHRNLTSDPYHLWTHRGFRITFQSFGDFLEAFEAYIKRDYHYLQSYEFANGVKEATITCD